MHPAIQGILNYFDCGHLPPALQEISRPFGILAKQVAERSPTSPETTVALRKLLEAKDAAVRAALPPKTNTEKVADAARQGYSGQGI